MSTRRVPLYDSQEFCAQAIQTLKSWDLPFGPRSYEIAYTYVNRSSAVLNRDINAITGSGRNLSKADIARLTEQHLPLERAGQRIERVGEALRDEVGQIAHMIETAISLSNELSLALEDSRENLGIPIDRETVRGIIDAILSLTRAVQQENLALGSRLQRSRDDVSKLQNDLIAIRSESLRDPLTGIAIRKHLDLFLDETIRQVQQTRKPLSFLLVDVDHFKRFNDNFGHLTGDDVLRLIADTLYKNMKGSGLVARYGGEEFAVVLPNMPLDHSRLLADKLRRAIAANQLVKRSTGEHLGRVTVSVGVSTWHAGEGMHALIEAADVCLYEAKKNGRNCVVVETELERVEETRRKAS